MLNFKQNSTKKGLALVLSAIAMFTGVDLNLLNTGVTEVLGAAGLAVTSGLGLWESFRNEDKEK